MAVHLSKTNLEGLQRMGNSVNRTIIGAKQVQYNQRRGWSITNDIKNYERRVTVGYMQGTIIGDSENI